MDILTPKHLKSHFAEISPTFENAMVGREDIGETMKQLLEENRIPKKPRGMLIWKFFAEKILFTTLLARRYLTHRLKIRKIYKFIQYALEKTFKSFDLQIAEARREGDKDLDKLILAFHFEIGGQLGVFCNVASTR